MPTLLIASTTSGGANPNNLPAPANASAADTKLTSTQPAIFFDLQTCDMTKLLELRWNVGWVNHRSTHQRRPTNLRGQSALVAASVAGVCVGFRATDWHAR